MIMDQPEFCSSKSVIIYQITISFSVASDERQANNSDDNGGRNSKTEMAPEREVVAKKLSPSSLLADYQIRSRTKQREISGHRAHPRQYKP